MIKASAWIAFAIQAVALVLFSAGFFEVRQKAAEANDPEKIVEYPEATYDRFVFVLLDALRSDFVFGNETKFRFLKEKLQESQYAKGFVALAEIPTVTLPRLKAMTAGSSPVFLDLILNFDEKSLASESIDEKGGSKMSGFMQENWVRGLKQTGKKLLMFGDDTWLRLYPDCFAHSVPTHSFFVSVHRCI
jgi:ethanolaminephosphotransferase